MAGMTKTTISTGTMGIRASSRRDKQGDTMDRICWIKPTQPDLETTLRQWQQEAPGCGVFALVPEAEKDQVSTLQSVCRAQAIDLAGGIFPALIKNDAFVNEGMWLIRMDHGLKARLVADLDQDDGATRLAQTAADLLPAESDDETPPTLCLIFDAMIGNIGSIVDTLYFELADRVRYTGVNAGSETFTPMPCVFDTDRCIGNGALCLLLDNPEAPEIDHGYPIPDKTMMASSTDGNCITSIDWQPAFEVYRELIATDYGVSLTRDNFYELACHFPFGILQADGSVLVRIPVALREDGSLFCVGEVPSNRLLVVLRAPQPVDNACIRHLASRHAPAGSNPVLFYCAGRRMHMAEGATEELTAIRQASDATLAGALSLGEVGSLQAGGYPMFHNAALVRLSMGAV